MSLQVSVELAAGETRCAYLVTSVADTRRDALEQTRRYEEPALERLFIDAPRLAAREVDRLGILDAELPHLQRLVSLLVYPRAAMRVVPALQDGSY